MQICKTCGISKPFVNFSLNGSGKKGYKKSCKLCRAAHAQQWRNQPGIRERQNVRTKIYRKQSHVQEQNKRYREENKERDSIWRAEYNIINKAAIAADKHVYYLNNKERILFRNEQWQQKNLDKVRDYNRFHLRKRRENPLKKLADDMRGIMCRAIKRYNGKKFYPMLETLGCSWEEFVAFIANKFYFDEKIQRILTWEDHGKYWEMDERIPASAWDLDNSDHFVACWHYTNRQPLTVAHNKKKGGTNKTNGKKYWKPFIEDRLNMLRMMGVI